MKKTLIIILSAMWCVAANAQLWPVPCIESRPGTRWWWPGSAVDMRDMSHMINKYAQAGLGTLEITPIYGVQGNEANELQYLSPEWMNMLRVAEQTAGNLRMHVDMNQGTGWPFGGPGVTLDDAACKAVFLIDTVPAGALPTKPLPDKDSDIATLLTESRRSLPDGNDEVIRLYQSRTRQKVKRAAPGGEGLVLDHLDSGAVARYLDTFDKAFKSSGTPYPDSFFNDSYEVYGADWTPSLPAEFKKRRGYDLLEKLPELLGFIDDGNRTLADYRMTIAELLLENFAEQWTRWCHDRDIKTRYQAHGSPANLIDLYAAADIPETESFGISNFKIKGLRTDPAYTRPNDSDAAMLKYASSAAHITGKPLTSSETFTWLTEHFRTSLSQMKPELDFMFVNGVNHVFFHGTTYSPDSVPWPGWKFYASVDMSPTNTIWRDASEMMMYITRSQAFLQSGRPDNDFLVYLPINDLWHKRLKPGAKGLPMAFTIHDMKNLAPEFTEIVNTIDSLGYSCDYISDRFLLETTVLDSLIATPGGIAYKALIVPDGANLPAAVAQQIDSLAARGARIFRGVDADSLALAAKPEAIRTELGLNMIRRATDDGYIYFIANLSPNNVFQPVPPARDFIDALWFDPMTGDVYQTDNYGNYIELNLRSGESRILRLYNRSIDKTGLRPVPPANESVEIDLTYGKWTLGFTDSYPEVNKMWKLTMVEPWTALHSPQLNNLAGTGVYRTSFKMNGDDLDRDWTLDLGDVRESARVYINGRYAGTAWAAPFVVNCNRLLVKGNNELRIEVTNLPANRIAEMDRKGEQWRNFKDINIVDINYKKNDYSDWKLMPSGLIGPVRLIRH